MIKFLHMLFGQSWREGLLVTGIVILLLVIFGTSGCAHVIVRDANTFTVEVLAAQKRQEEAAVVMRKAAIYLRDVGDRDRCVELAGPLLLIETTAANQAARALFLAGIEKVDPGEPGVVPDASTICGGAS